ncbi:hypothetical protein TRIP_C20924 [Candidatus Zixiibacteriota bacterium]|nr:hypothetical protein TRIP_C20924 [candidate division Zixibacteria bacterium]
MTVLPIFSSIIIVCGLGVIISAFKYRTVQGNALMTLFRKSEGGRWWATKDKFTPKGYRLFRIGSWLAACGALVLLIYQMA